nr:Rha family transcriptional regulator [Melissococcus plutonius]
MTDLVIMKDKQAITSSLQVAETFDKRHDHILRDLEGIKKDVPNFGEMFSGGNESDSYRRPRKVYYMNRDGFTLLAMGFTGQKALQFKLKYIEAFNRMENHIKQQLDTSNLSPELQFMNSVVQSLAKQELETKRIETKVDNIVEIVGTNTTDWRKDCRNLISKMAKSQGGYEAYREIQTTIYDEVDRRAGSSLKIRLTNMRRRMADEGICKSRRDKLNNIDVIDSDKRLKEIYLSVVKDFAIKYGIWK